MKIPGLLLQEGFINELFTGQYTVLDEPVVRWQKQLTNELRMQLVEEVDERVSKTLQEVFMDKGKSGWEGRETHK